MVDDSQSCALRLAYPRNVVSEAEEFESFPSLCLCPQIFQEQQ